MERRRNQRHKVWFPLRLATKRKDDRFGMCRNSSIAGMLLATPSKFAVGDSLSLAFRVSRGELHEQQVRATVVRREHEYGPERSWCPHIIAVKFEQSTPELERFLAVEASRQEATWP